MWLPSNFSVVQHISRIERNWNLHILQFTNIFMFRFDFFMLVIVFENRTELILVPVVQRFFVVIVVVAASRFRQIRWYLVEFAHAISPFNFQFIQFSETIACVYSLHILFN